jgi:large subunit ribosomal protein L18
MKCKSSEHRIARIKRHRRVRNKVLGTPERPRLNVFRSNSHIYAQIIDDVNHKTIVSASTLTKECKEKLGDKKSKVEQSKVVGELIAEKAKEAGIETIVFDRGGYLYHGRVKALAEAAREQGLKF